MKSCGVQTQTDKKGKAHTGLNASFSQETKTTFPHIQKMFLLSFFSFFEPVTYHTYTCDGVMRDREYRKHTPFTRHSCRLWTFLVHVLYSALKMTASEKLYVEGDGAKHTFQKKVLLFSAPAFKLDNSKRSCIVF